MQGVVHKVGPRPGRVAATALTALMLVAACSETEGPRLDAGGPPTPTATALPSPTPPPTPTEAPTATPVPTPGVVPTGRGVDDDSVRVGIIHTAASYPDVAVGVDARLARSARTGGVGGRIPEVVETIDDGGDPAVALAAARRLVEEVGVFAVVLASTAPVPAVTDYLESQQTPFFGWGYAPGFCSPNRWGFGFSGCLVGAVTGVEGARADPSSREVLSAHFGRVPDIVVVTTSGPAGDAADLAAREVWGDHLRAVVRLGDEEPDAAVDRVAEVVGSVGGTEVLYLSVGLEKTIVLKTRLGSRISAMVVDDVSYFPGLLSDFPTASSLEGGFALALMPPQEEYREVTGAIATDLDRIGGPLVYSQSVSIGYWSADLLVSIIEAVGSDLNAATFAQLVHGDGVYYDPAMTGGPCPVSTLDIQTLPAGGAALLQVRGGIYRPVVGFRCPEVEAR